jgi:hypothetical protein
LLLILNGLGTPRLVCGVAKPGLRDFPCAIIDRSGEGVKVFSPCSTTDRPQLHYCEPQREGDIQ